MVFLGGGRGAQQRGRKDIHTVCCSKWDAFESEKGAIKNYSRGTDRNKDPGQLRGMVTFPPRFRGEAEKVRDKEEEGTPSLP